MLDQINCSVKLANSGMPKNRRISPGALERIMSHDNYWFKFVISTEDCLKEIEEDFLKEKMTNGTGSRKKAEFQNQQSKHLFFKSSEACDPRGGCDSTSSSS